MSKAKALWVSNTPKHLLFWSLMLLMVFSFGQFTGAQAPQACNSADLIEAFQDKHQHETITPIHNNAWDLYGESNREEDEEDNRKEEEETEHNEITNIVCWAGAWTRLSAILLFEETAKEESFIEHENLAGLDLLPKYVLYSQFKFHLG